MFRRRRENKTDYSQRLALLKSGKCRLVVRRSNSRFHVQLVEFMPDGDRTLAEVDSGKLKKYGWKGSCGNISAAYLTGLLIGLEAKKKGVSEAVPDLGLQVATCGTSLYACLLGARDAGIKINIGKDAVPKKERIEGRHIEAYAKSVKNTPGYSRQFSLYLKNGMEPEKISEHFHDVKGRIEREAN